MKTIRILKAEPFSTRMNTKKTQYPRCRPVSLAKEEVKTKKDLRKSLWIWLSRIKVNF